MPLRRVDEQRWEQVRACRDPEHLPPTHVVLDPGLWEHTCPKCGRATIFRVPASASARLVQAHVETSEQTQKLLDRRAERERCQVDWCVLPRGHAGRCSKP